MHRRLITLGLAALLLLTFVSFGGGSVHAHAPHPALDFSIGIDIDGDGADECGTRTGENATCAIRTGSTFLVTTSLDSLPEDIGRYIGFDVILASTETPPTGYADANLWPDCASEGLAITPTAVAMGCAIFPPGNSSVYTGQIAQAGFRCPTVAAAAGVSIRHGDGDTGLLDTSNDYHREGEGVTETLAIECRDDAPVPVPPPGPSLAIRAFKLYVETYEPMPGWLMTLYQGDTCAGDPLASGTTSQDGTVDFVAPEPGTYSIREETRPGWDTLDGPCQNTTVADRGVLVSFVSTPDHNGDVNVDSAANAVDTLLTLQLITGLVDTLPDRPQGDVDRDLVVTAVDSSLILQYSAGLISSLPVGH